MLNAVADVHYRDDGSARGALLTATDPRFADGVQLVTVEVAYVEPYEPGAFHRRELPVPAQLVARLPTAPDLLVIDGYVTLDAAGRPGLGARAHAQFGVPVVGIAKTRFRTADHALPVLRGRATNPVWVTAAGYDPAAAAELVRAMAGPHRLPDAVRAVDRAARTAGQHP
jgi:deoxyribonuclease V